MNQHIKILYFLIKDNRVLVCENNMKEFYEQFPDVLKDARSYSYYYRLIKAGKSRQPVPAHEEYIIQSIVYPRSS